MNQSNDSIEFETFQDLELSDTTMSGDELMTELFDATNDAFENHIDEMEVEEAAKTLLLISKPSSSSE